LGDVPYVRLFLIILVVLWDDNVEIPLAGLELLQLVTIRVLFDSPGSMLTDRASLANTGWANIAFVGDSDVPVQSIWTFVPRCVRQSPSTIVISVWVFGVGNDVRQKIQVDSGIRFLFEDIDTTG